MQRVIIVLPAVRGRSWGVTAYPDMSEVHRRRPRRSLFAGKRLANAAWLRQVLQNMRPWKLPASFVRSTHRRVEIDADTIVAAQFSNS
jgi:hypothetical protein